MPGPKTCAGRPPASRVPVIGLLCPVILSGVLDFPTAFQIVTGTPLYFPCSLQGACAVRCLKGRWRIGVAAAVEVLDLVARRAVGAADAGKIARPDRRFAVAAGDVEHVSGLA